MQPPRKQETLLALFTVGYASHDQTSLIALLKAHGVTALADVRWSPYSAFKPEFNREQIGPAVEAEGIRYVYLGKELGARYAEPDILTDNVVDYEKVARYGPFLKGLDRVREGVRRFTVCLLCAQKDPINCHRAILISRQLCHEMRIGHLRDDGSVEPHDGLERRLVEMHGLDQLTLPGVAPGKDALDEAYLRQGRKIAYHPDTGEGD